MSNYVRKAVVVDEVNGDVIVATEFNNIFHLKANDRVVLGHTREDVWEVVRWETGFRIATNKRYVHAADILLVRRLVSPPGDTTDA